MKYLLLLLAIPFLPASECGSKKNKKISDDEKIVIVEKKINSKDSIPECIRKIIDDTKGKPGGLVKIDAYIYKSHTVYLMTVACCDQFNMLYDDGCKSMCAPGGGFTGKGDKKCPDFSDSAKFVKQIWKMDDN